MKTSFIKSLLGITLAAALSLFAFGCSVTTNNPNEAPANEPAKVDYPTKAITMIVPYAPGGSTDTYGRMLAVQLEKKLGVPITVNNMSGASGSIGTKFVYDAPADGYTIFFSAETIGTYRTMGTSELSYNDFTPISPVVNDPKVVVVSKNSKYNTIEELLQAIKEKPGKVTMSHSGPGGSGHNQGLILKALGYDVAMTGFDSGNNALLGVLGDQVDFTNANLSSVTSYMTSGDVKVLAIFANDRLEKYPDIPAFTEAMPEAESYLDIPLTPLSMLVKAGTPDEIVQILREEVNASFQEEEWNTFVEGNGADKLYEKYTDEASMKQFYADWESMICWLQYDNGVAKNSPESFNIPRIE